MQLKITKSLIKNQKNRKDLGGQSSPTRCRRWFKSNTMIYKTGEKPGKGLYQCTKCHQLVRLDDDSDTLPPCPKCDNTEYRKIG